MAQMTRAEQINFIHDLTRSVTTKLIDSLNKSEATADWDGHELRAILAEKFQDQTFHMSTRQKREFRNTCLSENI